MFTLYEFASSGNCYKLRLAMAQLDIPFQRIEKDITRGETRTAEFLAINPNGRIPVLVTPDNRVLPESSAALWYLARDSKLMPEDPFQQAQVLQWMFFEQYNHEPNIATSRYWIHVLGEQEKYAEALAEKQQKGHDALAVMETHLSDRDFFVGRDYSIADIALYAYTHVAGQGGFSLDAYPAIRGWLERVERQPGYVAMEA
ncbi:glutathione S-transferase family protein [Alcanivorax sp. IL3]|jgi:glutathione S-transferase|uniref:glutathione S-transferase family protein n=1 Tax=Alcanivorax TaxID=59753 RepID=UPI000C4D9407|nr:MULTISPECIES: glutathione S-transferase family protein [Alcanivorax]MAC15405.1 glutathione S-transferase [Alcanivorax sp.]MBG33035.1 glutathione S-transferase [Alcanivorax sp.]MBP22024.1 glutathione S-transferase [Alcanivorax sp.]MDF1636759.1 glutathione S-transferase family protein [Alcanivorax jadensis]|tara:strand:- start:2600 stop:3202 length:603 start_codon:yes stop_codon:yes gene_type:complete